MRVTLLFICFLFSGIGLLQAQSLSATENTEISILTIGPGTELYDKFGHSAFRVKDDVVGYDIVYNYGTYDFSTPNFYTKFARGKLLYQVTEGDFQPFLNRYIAQNRWVKEQQLNLSLADKQNLFNYLQENAKPENAKYKYDFFFDNCATKIRDVLVESVGDKVKYNDDYVEDQQTFRQLIQKNVDSNTWGSLGMDVAIGAVVDRKASAWQHQFLPNYIFKAAGTAQITNDNLNDSLVKNTTILFENTPKKEDQNFFLSPYFIFGVLAFLIIFVTFLDGIDNKRSRYLDALIFFISGLIGIVLLLLWVGTDHSTTVNNYNLLWAMPLNLFICYAIAKKTPKVWVRRYVLFLILMIVLLGVHWITGVQVFAWALLPLFIALAIRYVYVFQYLKSHEKSIS